MDARIPGALPRAVLFGPFGATHVGWAERSEPHQLNWHVGNVPHVLRLPAGFEQ